MLVMSISWKVLKLAALLHSADAEVRCCLLTVKRTNQFRLFLEYLGIPCPETTPLHEDNSVFISLVNAKEIKN